jgi:hypothetical protein
MGLVYAVLDISTAPLANAGDFLDVGDFSAPANYKDPLKIAAYLAEKQATEVAAAALDPDLCRITGLGLSSSYIQMIRTEDEERLALTHIARLLQTPTVLVSYNGLKFDFPVLNARALHLRVPLRIGLDRYKTSHIDLYDRLTNHGTLKGHSLQWWCRRLGWRDLVKPLSGRAESEVFATNAWPELEQSLRHDVAATERLAEWLGVLVA